MALAIPATASAATTPVTSLSGDWATYNSSTRLTPDGANFGVYPDANSFGMVIYNGMNGKTLADIKQLSYTFRYTAIEPTMTTAAPYMRIDLANGKRVILDPSMCATLKVKQNAVQTYEMTRDTVRYDDDECGPGGQQVSWDSIVAAHGSERIAGIKIKQGESGGEAFSADVTKMGLNGTDFIFGAPQQGPTGPRGANGSTGVNGSTGAAGAAGSTTVIHVTDSRHMTGNTLRTLRVSKRHKGARLKSATASLRGKKLKVRHGKVMVDLRHKSVGNYNVTITAKYLRGGKVHTHRSARKLSVAVA